MRVSASFSSSTLRGRLLAGGAIAVAAVLGLAGCSNTAASDSTSSTSSVPASSTSTATSSPPTSSTSSVPPTSASTTSTSVAQLANCAMSSVSVTRDKLAVSTASVYLGFKVTNTGSTSCTLDGYPTVSLNPAPGSSPINATFSHFGPAAAPLVASPAQPLGFVLKYMPAGGVTCGASDNAYVKSFTVLFPGSSGSAVLVNDGFHACPATNPTIGLTSILTMTEYHHVLPVSSGGS